MTTTPDLINSLATGLKPAPRGFVSRRLGLGIGAGVVLTIAAATLFALGLRPDLPTAFTSPPFWIKFAFTGLLMLAGLVAVWRLARPEGKVSRSMWAGIVGVLLAMSALAAVQLANAPVADYRALIMGKTAAICPWLIMLLSLPILAGALWAMRSMAPTHPTLAGASVGLAAGASAAFIYAFSCDESAMPFVLIWYGLGMAVPTLVGALLGRYLLRW